MITKLTVQGVKEAKLELSNCDVRIEKATRKSVLVVAKEKTKKLKTQLKAGAIAGKKLTGLTAIGRHYTSRKQNEDGAIGSVKFRPDKPLSRIAKYINYAENKKSLTGYSVDGGFVQKKGRGGNVYALLGKRLQAGYNIPVTKQSRKYFARVGGSLSKRSKFKKYFFLKKGTVMFTVPGRPVIDPFWESESNNIRSEVATNFKAAYADLAK